MNRHYITQSVWMAWVVLLLAPILALAQSPYEGIYIGTYHGPGDDGEFALIVNDHGYGRLAAFDSVDRAGYIEDNIHVGPDGAFLFETREGVHISGQTTAIQVSGQYSKGSRQGSFSGLRMSQEGPLSNDAGYYSGPVTMMGSGSDVVLHSHLVAIVAPDGTAFFLLKRGYRDGADVFPDGFDLDLDFGTDPDINIDFGSDFPFGPGADSPFPFGTGNNWPFPFGQGTNSWFPFAPGVWSFFSYSPFPGFSSSFGWGNGFGTSLDIGPFLDIDSRYYFGSGGCGSGWPFNVGLTFSISVSILGIVDVDFGTDWSDCSRFTTWTGFPLPVGVAGGTVQIASDGVIQASLPGGLVLQGVLDPATGMSEGILSYQQGTTTWSGNWSIDRYGAGGGNSFALLYGQLNDFNDDGFADVLWQDTVSGESVAWLMDGPATIAELPLDDPGVPEESSQWNLVAVRELDGDHEPDPVWRHASTGEVRVELSGGAGAINLGLDPAWQITGSGEFLAVPGPEFLLRHRGTGENAVITDLAGQPELASLPAMDSNGWSSVALADFDGNGYTDILWARQSSRELQLWLMDELTVAQAVLIPGEGRYGYQLAGVGDFGGDGSADLLWRRSTDGRLVIAADPTGPEAEDLELVASAARDWQVAAVGDLDGNGTDDLVWRNLLQGENAVWLIMDAQVVDTAPLDSMTGLFWTIRN